MTVRCISKNKFPNNKRGVAVSAWCSSEVGEKQLFFWWGMYRLLPVCVYLNHVRTRKVNIGTRDCDRVPPIDTVTNNFTQLFDQFSLIVLLMSPVLVTAYIITQRLDLRLVYSALNRKFYLPGNLGTIAAVLLGWDAVGHKDI